jgi:hypothetical protein
LIEKTDKVGGLEFKSNKDTNLSPPTRECEAVDPCARDHSGAALFSHRPLKASTLVATL